MAKPTRRTTTFLSLALATGLAGLAGLALAPTAGAEQALQGNYIVAHSINQATGLWIRMAGAEQTHELRCMLPNAEESEQIWCPEPGVVLPVDLVQSSQQQSLIAVDFLPLAQWADGHGVELLAIDPIEPRVDKAEAEWMGWPTGWVCNTEDKDTEKCVEACGDSGVKSLSAKPYPSNSQYATAEPQCEVECECNNSALDDDWIDPPEILPSYW